MFYQVAQAISEVLPAGDREKPWLQGMLHGRSRGGARSAPTQLDQGGEG